MRQPNWWRCFPRFTHADLPEIPEGWADVSWENDCCPSWQQGQLIVYVDYIDPNEREFPESRTRFTILECMHMTHLHSTNSWRDVLDYFGYSPLSAAPA